MIASQLVPLCTQIPYSDKFKSYKSTHRTRFLQFETLQEAETKALAEAFSEQSSEIFKRTVEKEIILPNVEDQKLVEGYTDEMLIQDFQNILVDVIHTSQNVPTVRSLEHILPYFPTQNHADIQKVFRYHVDEYTTKMKSVISSEKEEEDEEEELQQTKQIQVQDTRMQS